MSDRVALVLVDVLEAFFTPGRPAFYPVSAEVLGPLRELLARAREERRLVVHAVERHRPGLADFEHRKLPVHCEIGDDQSPYQVPPAGSPPHISTAQLPAGRTGEPPEYVRYEGRLAGTPSGNLDPPIYAPDFRRGALDGFEPDGSHREIEVPKRRYSAFYATDLDLLLREQGVQTLVIAGVKTNVCVRATVQDAFAAGYEVVVPREATNSNRPHLAAASLEDVQRYFGSVVSLAEALELL